MALYLGSTKKKIISHNSKLRPIIPSISLVSNSIRLVSSDNYILKDLNGLYLTTKESG